MDYKRPQFRLFHSLNILNKLQGIYSLLVPKGSKRHSLAHRIFKGIVNIRYQKWVEKFDKTSNLKFHHFRENINIMPYKPVLSVIMPVYNPNLKFLDLAIQSVRDQAYPKWELCIADDASTLPGVRELIQKHFLEDHRIKITYREVNGHISAASNSALNLASGDFIALLDQDDVLHPLAFHFVAEKINEHPENLVFYSDEDKITSTGKRFSPYFKSDFDEELFLSHNMVSHLGVYSTKLVRDLGGFRVGLEGSQDYDLMLRILSQINPHLIYHIPRILYHWRISSQSAAESVDAKPYALKAGEQALKDHLADRGIKAAVKPFQKYGYKILYDVPDSQPSVEVFFHHVQGQSIPEKFTQTIISSTLYKNLIVNRTTNDGSTTEKISAIENHQAKSTKENCNKSKKYLINGFVNASNAEVVALLHPSINSFSDYWVEDLVGILFKPGIGAVCPQLIMKNGLIHSSGTILGTEVLARHIFNGVPKSSPDLYFGWANLTKGYSALPPGCVLIKRKDFIEGGGLNQSLSNESAQIIDLCLKLKEKGLRNVVLPDVNMTVDPSKLSHSVGEDLINNPADREYFFTHWNKWLEHDPAFNPNLTLRKGRPTISKNPKIDYPTSHHE